MPCCSTSTTRCTTTRSHTRRRRGGRARDCGRARHRRPRADCSVRGRGRGVLAAPFTRRVRRDDGRRATAIVAERARPGRHRRSRVGVALGRTLPRLSEEALRAVSAGGCRLGGPNVAVAAAWASLRTDFRKRIGRRSSCYAWASSSMRFLSPTKSAWSSPTRCSSRTHAARWKLRRRTRRWLEIGTTAIYRGRSRPGWRPSG